MTILFLMSSLRSGSHMVRSMLRKDKLIVDNRLEHAPLLEVELPRIDQTRDLLIPLKYGYAAFTQDCIAAGSHPSSCTLVLYRRDIAAQARSLEHARKNRSWFGPTDRDEPISVTPEYVDIMTLKNNFDKKVLVSSLEISHKVLAYEDISVETVKSAMDELLGRDVTVVEPDTVKVARP